MANIPISPVPISAQAMADLLCTVVLLCRGVCDNGVPFWAYVCMKPSMAEAFKEAREQGAFNLEDFGTVVEWGEGEKIPEVVQARMKREYGVDEDYETKLIQSLRGGMASGS